MPSSFKDASPPTMASMELTASWWNYLLAVVTAHYQGSTIKAHQELAPSPLKLSLIPYQRLPTIVCLYLLLKFGSSEDVL